MWRREIYSLETLPEFAKIKCDSMLLFWGLEIPVASWEKQAKKVWIEDHQRERPIGYYDFNDKLHILKMITTPEDVPDATEKHMHVGAIWEICEHFGLSVPTKKIEACVKRCERLAWLEGVTLRKTLSPEHLAEIIAVRIKKIQALENGAQKQQEILFKADNYGIHFLPRKARWAALLMEIRFHKKKLEGMRSSF